ncbi:MAG TPA: flagellar assembly protein FliW [Polyangiaceae bacterium]|nr:flagellar assembly protein FliW [Polyangiaceae bacterium]
MIVKSERLGNVEIDAGDIITFPAGIVGFPGEREFVLIRLKTSSPVGWLQSVKSSYLTLPVVSAHALPPRFPDVVIEDQTERLGLGRDSEAFAVLAVLSAPSGEPATVNLMAPIIVNAKTRIGAQVVLEGTHFSTREVFVLAREGSHDIEATPLAPSEP